MTRGGLGIDKGKMQTKKFYWEAAIWVVGADPKNIFSNVKKFKIIFLHVVQHISSQHKKLREEKTFFATCAKKTNSDIRKCTYMCRNFVFLYRLLKKIHHDNFCANISRCNVHPDFFLKFFDILKKNQK